MSQKESSQSFTISFSVKHKENLKYKEIEQILKDQAVRWGELIKMKPATRKKIKSRKCKYHSWYSMYVTYGLDNK
jgi:hypothetical protein